MPSGAATMQTSRMCGAPARDEHVQRRDGAAAGGQHRINHQHVALFEPRRQLRVVLRRDRGALVALQPDMADARARNQLQHAGQHAEAGAQHRHEDDVGRAPGGRAPDRAASPPCSAVVGTSRSASAASNTLMRPAS